LPVALREVELRSSVAPAQPCGGRGALLRRRPEASLAKIVACPEFELRARVLLVGGTAEDASSIAIVMRHARTIAVEQPEATLRGQVALVGGAVEEGSSLGVVLRPVLPTVVAMCEGMLRVRVAQVSLSAELDHVHRTWQRQDAEDWPEEREARCAERSASGYGRR